MKILTSPRVLTNCVSRRACLAAACAVVVRASTCTWICIAVFNISALLADGVSPDVSGHGRRDTDTCGADTDSLIVCRAVLERGYAQRLAR